MGDEKRSKTDTMLIEDPEITAIAVMVELLEALPDAGCRARVVEYLEDRYCE